MKVLIIGLGSIAQKHIPALRQAGVEEIFALRSSPDSAEFEGVRNIYSIKEIEKYNFDFFIVSNVTSKHFDTLEKLEKFEKPLFIEKPLFAKTGAQEEALVTKIAQRNFPTYVACNLRFLDSLRKIKELSKGFRINEINVYCGSYLPEWRPNQDFRTNYSARKELGGGVHVDLIHELDYLFWIFGSPTNTTAMFSSKSSLEISAVDYANYLWEYPGFNANVILNYFRRDQKRILEVVTEEGTYWADLLKNKVFKDKSEIFSSDQKIADTFNVQMQYFVKEILNTNKNGFNSIEEAYKVLKLCLKN